MIEIPMAAIIGGAALFVMVLAIIAVVIRRRRKDDNNDQAEPVHVVEEPVFGPEELLQTKAIPEILLNSEFEFDETQGITKNVFTTICAHGTEEQLKVLLEMEEIKALLDGDWGSAGMQSAISNNNPVTTKTLLGQETILQRQHLQMVLELACRLGNEEIVYMFLDAEVLAVWNEVPLYLLVHTILQKNTELALKLFNNQAVRLQAQNSYTHESVEEITPAGIACMVGDLRFLQEMIRVMGDDIVHDAKPLYLAAFRGHAEIVAELLKFKGVRDRAHLRVFDEAVQNTALWTAVHHCYWEIAIMLLEIPLVAQNSQAVIESAMQVKYVGGGYGQLMEGMRYPSIYRRLSPEFLNKIAAGVAGMGPRLALKEFSNRYMRGHVFQDQSHYKRYFSGIFTSDDFMNLRRLWLDMERVYQKGVEKMELVKNAGIPIAMLPPHLLIRVLGEVFFSFYEGNASKMISYMIATPLKTNDFHKAQMAIAMKEVVWDPKEVRQREETRNLYTPSKT